MRLRKESEKIGKRRNLLLELIVILAGLLYFRLFFYPGSLKADLQVKVIENKGKPTGNQIFCIEKELTIGKLNEGGSVFGMVSGLVVAADGRIFVLDSKDKKPKIFDSSGKMIMELGCGGQGPGQWLFPAGLQLLSNQMLITNDPGGRKLIYLDLEGNFLKEVSYAQKITALMKFIMFEDGNRFIGMGMTLSGNVLSYDVAVHDADFSQLFKIDVLPVPLPVGGTKVNPFEFSCDFCLDRSGNIIYARANNYELRYFTPEGKLFKIVRKEYQPQPITRKDKEEILKMLPETPGFNVKEIVIFPDNFPAIKSFFLDEEERLYVCTYEKGKAPDSYIVDIFSREAIHCTERISGSRACF